MCIRDSNLLGDGRVVLKELTDLLSSLTELITLIGEPRTGLLDHANLLGHVDHRALTGNAFTVEHVEFGGLERRGHLEMCIRDRGRTVAIKVMHTQLAKGPHREQFVERFRREANSAASIANPHIVQVYDTGEFNGLDFLVMEYVHGVNLRHEMNAQGTFSVRETLRVVAETLDGLASAHRAGVVQDVYKRQPLTVSPGLGSRLVVTV